jgi:hypothetical protein
MPSFPSPKAVPPPGPGDTICQIQLVPQTGMPSTYFQRSKEVSMLYDALGGDNKFIFNPFGPQLLNLTRPNKHW